MEWKKLIDENDAQPFNEKLSQISEALGNHFSKPEENISLMGGKIGVAIYYFYYARFTGDDSYADRAVDMISEVFDAINNGFTYHTQAGGLAGIGWVLEHLVQSGYLDTDTNEILEPLDPYLYKAMMHEIGNKHYDFLHGAVGIGSYFLHRLTNPNAKTYITELVDKMAEIAHKDDDGAMKWESVLNIEEGNKGYNLSLSHGISAIIAFFAKVIEADIHKEKTTALLEGSVKYLLKNRLDRSKHLSNFPSWIDDKQEKAHSRLAWCYGDLGNGLALLQAARSIGNKDWEKIAIDILVDSTSRRDVKENMVIDAGLCHGGAGIMHIYNRAYNYTGLDIFKETALYWAQETLKLARFEDGYAGFKAWHTEKYGGWLNEAGLLEGVSGIGLAFISLLADIEPGWDRCLFIS